MELSRSYPFSCALFCKIFLQIGQIDDETTKKKKYLVKMMVHCNYNANSETFSHHCACFRVCTCPYSTEM